GDRAGQAATGTVVIAVLHGAPIGRAVAPDADGAVEVVVQYAACAHRYRARAGGGVHEPHVLGIAIGTRWGAARIGREITAGGRGADGAERGEAIAHRDRTAALVVGDRRCAAHGQGGTGRWVIGVGDQAAARALSQHD